jgi:biofilm PGA synthesis N-glycosyltransferase PgaC
MTPGSYVIVSPVKNEERYVEATLQSVLSQTVKPVRWIIVDDGSSDRTPEILRRYAQQADWIHILRLDHTQSRQPGTPVVYAFRRGFELVRPETAQFVVKLDCDVKLPPDYFELLLARFAEDPELGIASGIYLEEQDGNSWQPVPMPSYHAAGASKMMRADCYRQIGGFVQSPGWDTVDEIRAEVRGWKTRHFEEIRFHHLKREGSGIGSLATSVMHGRVYYLTGGGKLFLLLKILHRMISERPYLLSGLALLWGFLKTMFSGQRKLVTSEEARFYARRLNRRIWGSPGIFFQPSHESHPGASE